MIGKEKNTDKLLANIEASKTNDAARLLTALGIRNVGRSTARTIMRHFPDIDAVAAASVEELTAVPDIGQTTAEGITAFFRNEANRAVLEKLRAAGVNMGEPAAATQDKLSLGGLTFVVTGTLPTLGRREVTELIEDNGGRVSGSISKKTSYLVAGEAAGSKLTKAEQLGIPVIDEDALRKMIG